MRFVTVMLIKTDSRGYIEITFRHVIDRLNLVKDAIYGGPSASTIEQRLEDFNRLKREDEAGPFIFHSDHYPFSDDPALLKSISAIIPASSSKRDPQDDKSRITLPSD